MYFANPFMIASGVQSQPLNNLRSLNRDVVRDAARDDGLHIWAVVRLCPSRDGPVLRCSRRRFADIEDVGPLFYLFVKVLSTLR